MTVGQGAVPTPPPPTSVPALLSKAIGQNATALGKWNQGDIIGSPDDPHPVPFTWVMPPGTDLITGTVNRSLGVRPYYSSASSSLYVVASQSCDVSGADTGKQHPLILAAPLTSSDQFDLSVTSLAVKGRVGYLIRSTYHDTLAPTLTWFADLRMLVPISKGVLLTRQASVRAFDDAGLLRFAAALSHKFGRAALEDVLAVDLPKALSAHVTSIGPSDPVFVDTEEVRLQITGGSSLAATGVRIVVLVDAKVAKQAKKTWTGWETSVRTKLANQNIHLGSTHIGTANTLKAAVYRETVPLRIDALGPSRWV